MSIPKQDKQSSFFRSPTAAPNNMLHTCALLGPGPNDTYRYWDPMWNWPAVGLYDEGNMKKHWDDKESYNYGVLVPSWKDGPDSTNKKK